MTKLLARQCSSISLIEPEEDQWPDILKSEGIVDSFTMWMGFRGIWLPLQYQAQALKKQNKTVFLDTYFIKILGYELDEPGVEWLFPRNDPYFSLFYQICKLDIEQLPDPDCIVLIDVTYDDWLKLLGTRSRNWDKRPGFAESYSYTLQAIDHAVEQLCHERNIRLIRFHTEFGDANEQSARLRSLLIQEKVL